MKFTKKIISLSLLAVLGLAACGNQNNSTSPSTSSTTGTGSEKLTWAVWDKDASTYYQPLIDEFEKQNEGVEVELLDLGSTDYMTVLGTQLSGGSNNIDVALIKDMPGYASLVNKKQIDPLTDLVDQSRIDQYGGVIEQITVDGNFYALPIRNDFFVMYYNKDLFDAAKMEYPKKGITWKEYVAMIEEVSKKASEVTGKKVYGGHFHTWRSQVQLYGILDGKNTLVSTDYSFLQPFYDDVIKLQKGEFIQDYASIKTANLHYSAAFYQNNVASLVMGSWFIPTLAKAIENGDSEKFNWGIASMPIPDESAAGSTAGNITSVAINTNSKNKELAKKFVEFVSSEEGSRIIAETGTMPAIQSQDVVDFISSINGFPSDPESKEALKVDKIYLEIPLDPKTAEIETILNDAHDGIMTDNVTVKEGLDEANTLVNNLK